MYITHCAAFRYRTVAILRYQRLFNGSNTELFGVSSGGRGALFVPNSILTLAKRSGQRRQLTLKTSTNDKMSPKNQ